MNLVISCAILSLCVVPILPQEQCHAKDKPAKFVPSSYIYYMDMLVEKVNLVLGLKINKKDVSKSFFEEAYKLMEQGNNTKVNLTRGCVEGVMDLGKIC